MRRRVLLVALAVVVLAAAPAAAQEQRDPFRPVIDPDAGTTTATTDTGTVVEPTDTEPAPVRSETLSNTGVDALPWLIVALGLILVGGGSLYAARLYRKPLV